MKSGQMNSQNILLPNADKSNLSHEFVVEGRPGILRAFNLSDGQEVRIEQGVYLYCMEPHWGPYLPCDGCGKITTTLTTLKIHYSGLYRVFVHDPNNIGVDDVVVVWHEQAVDCP